MFEDLNVWMLECLCPSIAGLINNFHYSRIFSLIALLQEQSKAVEILVQDKLGLCSLGIQKLGSQILGHDMKTKI
jgi:hypothetical protein